jgi:hypothetical protein
MNQRNRVPKKERKKIQPIRFIRKLCCTGVVIIFIVFFIPFVVEEVFSIMICHAKKATTSWMVYFTKK